MEKEIFEVVLRKSFTDTNIKRIIEMQWDSALPKGENYNSTILVVSLKVVLGNGRIANKSLIVKKENSGKAAKKITEDLDLFKLEALVYTDILREMDYLMEEFGDTEGPLWCKFFHYIPSDGMIVLENLKASGFLNVNRSEALDLDHARLVLRSLGRYHAMTKTIEGRGLISKRAYKPYMFLYDEVYIRNLIFAGRKALIKAMKSDWGEEWAEIADKLSLLPFEQFKKRINDSGHFEDDIFRCMNHGDCWMNNMLFKYSWDGKPVGVRFVDFQFPHYNTPCVDLIYFIYTSIKPCLRRKYYESLIGLYYESLTSSLDFFGYDGPRPTLEDINNALEHLSYFGLTFFTTFFPLFQTKDSDGMDLEKLFETNGEEGMKTSVFSEDGMIEKMGEEIKRIVAMEEN